MGNDDLRNALMRAQGIQGFMGGGMASHTMPDGTVMPGATHADYESMGYQEGGPAQSISPELQERINRFAGDPGIYAKLPEMSEQERFAQQRMGEGISATGPFGEPLPLDANSGMSFQQLKEALAGQETAPTAPTPAAPAQELQQATQQLEIQKTQTSDPDEIQSLNRMIDRKASCRERV